MVQIQKGNHASFDFFFWIESGMDVFDSVCEIHLIFAEEPSVWNILWQKGIQKKKIINIADAL